MVVANVVEAVAVEQLVLVRIRPLELPIYLEKVIKLDVVT